MGLIWTVLGKEYTTVLKFYKFTHENNNIFDLARGFQDLNLKHITLGIPKSTHNVHFVQKKKHLINTCTPIISEPMFILHNPISK